MDVAGIDLNLLTAFDALAKERSVTRAGARIGLSQPAMSHALLRLRTLLGDDLFVRTPAGMEPTARARELAGVIAPALEQLRRALEPPPRFEPAESERAFTAGMAEYAEIALVRALAREFRARAPKANLRIVPMTKHDYEARLDAGQLDVALGNLRHTTPRFQRTDLFTDPLVCLARAKHPAFRKRLTLERYVALPHVLVSPTGEPFGAVDAALEPYARTRRIALVVGTYLALPLALAGGDLVATLPSRVATTLAAMGALEARPLPLSVAASVAMVWHQRDAGDLAHAWFRALLARVASG